MRTSLPASARLPLTIESAGRDNGTLSASLSSAAPVADAAASALPVQRPTGVDVDEAQHVGERPARSALDVEARAAAELGDAPLDAAPLDVADLRPRGADVEGRAIDDDLARRRGERRPRLARRRRRRCRCRLGRHVGEGHALDLGGDAEIAFARDLRRRGTGSPRDRRGRGRSRSRSFLRAPRRRRSCARLRGRPSGR